MTYGSPTNPNTGVAFTLTAEPCCVECGTFDNIAQQFDLLADCLVWLCLTCHTSENPDATWSVDGPGVQWICKVCDGAEECAPGFDAPIPPVCPSCAPLELAESIALWGVQW